MSGVSIRRICYLALAGVSCTRLSETDVIVVRVDTDSLASGDSYHSPADASGDSYHSPADASGDSYYSPADASGDSYYSPADAGGADPSSGDVNAATDSAAGCDGEPHLSVQHRTRYQSASVPFGSACVSQDQTRTCHNGVWSSWGGTYTYLACIEDGLGLVYYYGCETLSSGRVADEVSGTDIGGSRNVTVTSSGKIGSGFSLGGDSNIWVDTGIAYLNSATTPPFSISAWVWLSTLPSVLGHDSYIFGTTADVSPWTPLNGGVRASDDRIVFTLTNSSATEFSVVSVDPLTSGAWHHVAFVCEDDGLMRIYVDGADQTSATASFSGTFFTLNGGENYGALYWGSGLGIVGNIDEVSLYDLALSASRVSSLYNAGSGKTFPF